MLATTRHSQVALRDTPSGCPPLPQGGGHAGQPGSPLPHVLARPLSGSHTPRSYPELRATLRRPPSASSAGARKAMVGNRRRDSRAETAIRRQLHKAGCRYRVDFPIRIPGRRPIRPDVVFTRARIAVFVDGCFWHGCPEHGTQPRANSRYWRAKIEVNQMRDHEQTAALERYGWTVIRIWEHEDPVRAAARVIEALTGSAPCSG